MYKIQFADSAAKDLAEMRAHDRVTIVQTIFDQLLHEPITPTRRRKLLTGMTPPFEAVAPLWQLRVGEHRVFYDVDEEETTVFVRAVRHKPPHKTTEDIL